LGRELPKYVSVTVTSHGNGATPDMIGWSNDDYYEFCCLCGRNREDIWHWLLDMVEVKRKNGGNHWVKRSEVEWAAAIFDTLLNAHCFANDMSHLPGILILECKYTQSKKNMLWWQTRKEINTLHKRYCPKGTLLADTITPIKAVERRWEI
jgi:hypothetical protein